MALNDNEIKCTKEDVNKIFDSMDIDREGRIGFMDFCPCMISKHDLTSRDNTKAFLEVLDSDKDKVISFGDLRRLFSNEKVFDDQINAMISQVIGEPLNVDTVVHENEGITFKDILMLN